MYLSTAKYEFSSKFQIWVAYRRPKIRWATLESILICYIHACRPRVSCRDKSIQFHASHMYLKVPKDLNFAQYFNLGGLSTAQNSVGHPGMDFN